MKLDIPENWRPTTANINALPLPLRRYIHALETRYGPTGDFQTIAILMAQITELQKLLADERREKSQDTLASATAACQRRFSA